ITVHSAQLRILAELGRTDGAAEDAARLASSARETTEPQQISIAFTAAALMLLAQGREDAAHALLQELEQTPAIRGDHRYAANLPALVRCALALGDAALAARLVEDVRSRAPVHEHAFCAARA